MSLRRSSSTRSDIFVDEHLVVALPGRSWGRVLAHAERLVGMHFFNRVAMMSLPSSWIGMSETDEGHACERPAPSRRSSASAGGARRATCLVFVVEIACRPG